MPRKLFETARISPILDHGNPRSCSHSQLSQCSCILIIQLLLEFRNDTHRMLPCACTGCQVASADIRGKGGFNGTHDGGAGDGKKRNPIFLSEDILDRFGVAHSSLAVCSYGSHRHHHYRHEGSQPSRRSQFPPRPSCNPRRPLPSASGCSHRGRPMRHLTPLRWPMAIEKDPPWSLFLLQLPP